MSRKTKGAIGAVGVAAIAAGALAAYVRAPDERAYVSANLRALESLPVYPRARAVATTSSACASNDTPWARTVGYYTTREYELPRNVPPREVLRFFESGGNGWRTVDVFQAARALNLARGDAVAHVLVSSGRYTVGVDHDSRGCP